MTDRFEFKAYASPFLIVTAPAITAVQVAIVVFGGSWEWWQLAPVPLWVVIGTLIAHIAHDPGRHLQERLWTGWGGPPTTIFLRWSQTDNAVQLADLHAAINSIVGPSIVLPNEADERADPRRADDVYAAATSRLRALTGATENFPQLKEHLIWYCYRRTLLGLRLPGLVIAAIGILGGAALIAFGIASNWVSAPAVGGLAIVTVSILVATFLGRVSPGFVRQAADRYAIELLKTPYTL